MDMERKAESLAFGIPVKQDPLSREAEEMGFKLLCNKAGYTAGGYLCGQSTHPVPASQ